MSRKLRKRIGHGIQAIFIKWTSKTFASSSAISPSPNPSIQLPNELIQYILEHLYSDTPTLLNCALVARAWATPSQRGIFREVILQLPYASSRKKTYRLFAASYVQLLKLYNFYGYLVEEATVTFLHAAAALIIQRLSKARVNKVHISGVAWYRLRISLKSALTDIFRAPSLTEVQLFYFPIFTFAELASGYATHLKVLHVSGDWDIRDGSSILQSHMEKSVAPRSIQLDQLGLGYIPRFDFLTWLQQDSCPFDVRNLQVLRIGINPYASAMVRYLGRSLRELELLEDYPFYRNQSDLVNVIPLEYTPNLRSLTVNITTDCPVRYIEALFEPLQNPDVDARFSLRRLNINVRFYYPGTAPSIQNLCERWAALNTILENPEFSLLEIVHIRLIEDLRAIPKILREFFRRTFSSLEGSRRLVVQVEE
ncbi:hypothetical protein BT96DRAFT_930037 [Gymnopus androsaceus JB14]|uniref:F-box domain-containing protein n=1 Tax=Gymnopus androsaceus JB14 TaxID=1447944 RepID=A0A6A4GC99_9AGAR|nr:hypothetical protein BT96DRAFT_930037 [Gymnopus androsaceus JB14]